MRNHYNENNPVEDADEEEDEDEFSGYAITDDSGREVERGKKKKKKSYDDQDDSKDEPVEASPIPENEQTVMIDNARVSRLNEGDALTLKITGEQSGEVHGESGKVGDLKPAYVRKLSENRKGWYAQCFLYSASAPAMVKIKFSEKPGKGAVKI